MKQCMAVLVDLACHPAVMQAAPREDIHGLDAQKRAAKAQSTIQKLLLCHDKHGFGAPAVLKVGQLLKFIRGHIECTIRSATQSLPTLHV